MRGGAKIDNWWSPSQFGNYHPSPGIALVIESAASFWPLPVKLLADPANPLRTLIGV